MRHVTIALLSGIIFCWAATQALAAVPEVIINEVQISGGKADDDFIELYNTTSQPVDISGWKLKKRIKSGTESTVKDFSVADNMSISIPAKKYLLWANAAGKFKAFTEEQFVTSTSLTDNNSIALLDKQNALVDAVTYGSDHTSPFMPSLIYPLNPAANTSIERDVVKNLFVAQLTPTPQNDSTVDEKPIVEKKIDQPVDDTSSTVQSGTVRINELFPNPKEKGEANEFIELYNFGTEDIDLAGFVLHDASATGKYILPAGSLLPKQAYFLVTREKSKLSLNNTDETISLFAPTSELLDAVTYATSKEGASLSYDGSGYRWSKYLTPGAANQFSDAPQIEQTKIPKKAYPNLPVLFSAKGDADETVVYLWDFGDGVKSRKQNVTHTYKKKGKYDGSLTLTGSLENSVKNFTVQVKKMPPQKVTITKVTPNPPGADAQGESLTVKNEGKKKIDLSGWSIATGTSKKKLANHPVRESFVLKSGEERVLTTDLAAFSLPNKIGFVELRQPDKKIAQKISYAKATGIKEGEVYQKQAGKMWAWANPVPVAMLAETKSSKSVALANNAEKTDATIAIQSEEKKPITLADLSPEDVATLKAQVKEELRQEVLAELAAQKAEGENSSEKASLEILPEKTAENVVETSTVLGAETEREGIAAEAVPAEKSTITSETITEKKNSAGWFSGIWQQTNGAVNKLLLQTQ